MKISRTRFNRNVFFSFEVETHGRTTRLSIMRSLHAREERNTSVRELPSKNIVRSRGLSFSPRYPLHLDHQLKLYTVYSQVISKLLQYATGRDY